MRGKPPSAPNGCTEEGRVSPGTALEDDDVPGRHRRVPQNRQPRRKAYWERDNRIDGVTNSWLLRNVCTEQEPGLGGHANWDGNLRLVRLALTAVLLVCGLGLLRMPLGTSVGSLVGRSWAREKCLQLLAGHPSPGNADPKNLLTNLWPNSWRTGALVVAGYLTANGNTHICAYVLGLRATAEYGLSAQPMGVILGMSGVWTLVKWPLAGQYLARHDYRALRQILQPRVRLQYLSYLSLATGLILCGPYLLKWFGSGKKMLPPSWLCLMSLDSFLLMQFSFWTTLILAQNRLPSLWPTVATNVLSLVLSLTLVHFTSLGTGALVLGPLIAGCLFNYWYWPPYAARSVGTSLFRFLFNRPDQPGTRIAAPG